MVAQQFPTTPRANRARHILGYWRHPVAQALLKAFLTVFVTTSITFFLIRLMPGNPVDIKIDDLTKDGLMTYQEARAQAASLFSIDLGVELRWVPITQMRGATSPGIQPGFTFTFVGDVLFHAALPISVFFLATLGHWILGMKSATINALEEDYVNAARARGLSDGRIMTAYVGRNAVLPLVTQLAITAGLAIGGSILIEQYFVYQGVGLRLQAAVTQRDYPVMQGILLMVTLSVVLANLAADLLYSKLDPRIDRKSTRLNSSH